MRSSLESPLCESRRLSETATTTLCSRYRERVRSRRGLRAWRTRTGAPGNLGGLVILVECGMDTPRIKSRPRDGLAS